MSNGEEVVRGRPKVEKDKELKPLDSTKSAGEDAGRAGWLMAPSQKYVYKKRHRRHPKNTNDMIGACAARIGSLRPTAKRRMVKRIWRSPREDEPMKEMPLGTKPTSPD
ncbi:hypothetical protein FNV43_RR11238 [Rhamnella rubrinervis]|uniref:Uncharacterized protein n=1 Tax=Rhamnella rubrinervis TaxID=2594499 RepID=A0A8K0MH21_9ROSA|nr:hypothetical protein FNV43_RR11238 [Rhamnella rubrinervis]